MKAINPQYYRGKYAQRFGTRSDRLEAERQDAIVIPAIVVKTELDEAYRLNTDYTPCIVDDQELERWIAESLPEVNPVVSEFDESSYFS